MTACLLTSAVNKTLRLSFSIRHPRTSTKSLLQPATAPYLDISCSTFAIQWQTILRHGRHKFVSRSQRIFQRRLRYDVQIQLASIPWTVSSRLTSSSAMAERSRNARSAVFAGWVTLGLNFRLKGYVSRQFLWTIR